jgi:hypothetical protein
MYQSVSFLFFLHLFFTVCFLFIFPLIFYSVVFSETRDTDPVAGNQKQGAGEAAHVPGTNKIAVHLEPLLRIRMFIPDSDFLPSGSRIPDLRRTKKRREEFF